jgi:hypothetical protein
MVPVTTSDAPLDVDVKKTLSKKTSERAASETVESSPSEKIQASC